MTVGQLAEEIATELGEPYGDPDVGLQFERWVSETIADIYGLEEWIFAMGAVDLELEQGGSTYDLDAEVGTVRALVDKSTGEPLEGTTRETLIRRCADLSESGDPEAWFLEGVDSNTGQLRLRVWPVPTGGRTLDLQYTKLAPLLDEASDAVSVPPDVIRAARHGVRARFYENAGDGDGADRATLRLSQALATLRRRYVHHTGVDRKVRFGDLSRTSFTTPRLPRNIPG